jgi:hypothetical protein
MSHPESPSATLEDGFTVTSVDFRKRACSIDRVGHRARRHFGEDPALFGRPCAKSPKSELKKTNWTWDVAHCPVKSEAEQKRNHRARVGVSM